MSKIKLTPLTRFWLLLKPDQEEIKNIYIYAIIIGLLNLVLPVGIQSIINLIQGGTISASWFVLILLVAGAITLSGILQLNQLRITETLQQKIFTRAAFEFTYRIPKIKLEELFHKHVPELMNRFFDVMSIQKGIAKILIDFSTASIQILFGLMLLSLYHPFFILFSLILIILLVAIYWFTIKRGIQTSLYESRHKYLTASWLEEMARSNITFKLAGRSPLALDRINAHAVDYNQSREKHFSILLFQYRLMVGFKVLVAVSLLLIGGLLVIDQQINIGQFVAAEIVILLVVSSVEKIILNFETIYDVLTALEKVGSVNDLELETDIGIPLPQSADGLQISLNKLAYSYPEEQKMALENISININPTERILIRGHNNSGKSTLLHIISGLIAPTLGSITVENTPIANLSSDELRSEIGGYLQDGTLFEGSLLENITIGRKKASLENVKWASETVGLDKLVNELSAGYETHIYPMGKQFARSTVAKILVARAIVTKPRLLLLENSFGDFADEDRDRLLCLLLNREYPWTVILSSSHPINLPELIDREVILKNGQIIQPNS